MRASRVYSLGGAVRLAPSLQDHPRNQHVDDASPFATHLCVRAARWGRVARPDRNRGRRFTCADNFDLRVRGDEPASGEALRDRLGRFGLVTSEPRTGTPRAVAKLNGFLTGASGAPGAEVALDYVRDHPGVFKLDDGDLDGLRLVDRGRSGGIEHLTWEQRYRGIPAADTQLQAAVDASGRLMTVTGSPAPDLAIRSIEPSVSAERAYAAVRESAAAVASRAEGPERRTTFADGGRASLTLYQDGDGAQLGWRVLAHVSSTEVYDALVDARTGAVVRRSNRVHFAGAPMIIRVEPARHAAGGVSVPRIPELWLPATATKLKGPFVHAFVDPT